MFDDDDYVSHFSTVLQQIKTCDDRGLPIKETPSFVRVLHTVVDCAAKPVTTTGPDRQATQTHCLTQSLTGHS
jgi:hypothetical protein